MARPSGSASARRNRCGRVGPCREIPGRARFRRFQIRTTPTCFLTVAPLKLGGCIPGQVVYTICENVLAVFGVNRFFELLKQTEHSRVGEGQHLRKNHAAHRLFTVDPEIGVVQAGPHQTAPSTTARDRF